MKKVQHLIEAIIVAFLLLIFKLLPFHIASNLGSFIARIFFPFLKFNQRAKNNIKIAFPEITERGINDIIKGMWDNLGRSIAEFPHIYKLFQDKFGYLVKINNIENLDYLKDGGILMTAHIGNWEIGNHLSCLRKKKISIIYRPANNKIIDKVINYFRTLNNVNIIPKGIHGAKEIIREIKNKNIVVMLVDQKMLSGIEVPFFNKSAFTAPAIAQLAIQYKVPIVPIHSIRTNNKIHKFEIFVEKPLLIEFTDDKIKDTYNIMLAINKLLESWISKNPSQWFWIHNRWAKNKTH